MSFRASISLGVFTLAILAGGCQRGYTFVPVEGTITKGGQPLAGIQVLFFPDPTSGTEGLQARGFTDPAGHYRLRSDGGEGAIVGHYLVCVIEPRSSGGSLEALPDGGVTSSHLKEPSRRKKRSMPKEPTESRVPAIYGQLNKTPLQVDVRPGGLQTFDFNIP